MLLKNLIFKDDWFQFPYILISNLINPKYYKVYGKNVKFAKPLFVKGPENISIGNNVTIRSGIRLETIEKCRGRRLSPDLVIGNNVNIEQNCHIICANKLVIGNGTLISSNVFITDCNHIYKDIKKRVLEQGLDVKITCIGDNSFIGTGAKIMAGVNLGKHCIVSAGCIVNSDVPDYSVVAGIPGKVIKYYNKELKKWIRI